MTRLQEWWIAERTVIAIIVLNTLALVAIGYTDPQLLAKGMQADLLSTRIYQIAFWCDYACVIYFLLEVLLKVRSHGWRGYWASGWNRFDFSVILLSAPVLLSPILDLRELSVLLALRLGRLFRLFRVMRFIPNREHLYRGMKRALRASVGVFLALLLINVVLSLGATQLFGRWAPEYFGNPAIASYSLFRVFTVEGWYEIPDHIARTAPPIIGVMARVYFVIAVTLGGVLGLSLANAVFVDEMTIDNNSGLERKVDALMLQLDALQRRLEQSHEVGGPEADDAAEDRAQPHSERDAHDDTQRAGPAEDDER